MILLPIIFLSLAATARADVRDFLMSCDGFLGVEGITKHLDKGMDINISKSPYNTCLAEASERHGAEVLEMLLSRGAKINFAPKGEKTPLMAAASAGHVENVRFLLSKGADAKQAFTEGNYAGWTALHFASDPRIVKLLLDAGAPLEAKTKEGATALYWAAITCKADAAKAFLDAGADPNLLVGDYNASTPLTHLMGNYSSRNAPACQQTIKALVAAGADVDAKKAGSAPLAIASGYGEKDPAAVKLLLALGASPDGAHADNSSPLQNAAEYNHPEIAALLLAAGANPDRRTRYAESARDLFAKKHGVDIDTLQPLTVKVNRFVQRKLDAWLKKDEFESVADYNARMKGKRQKVSEFMGEAFGEYGVWGRISIGLYDAESETFKLSSPELGDMIVPVPKARAKAFKDSFRSFAFKPSFVPAGEGWKLAKLEFKAGNEVFLYDSAKQVSYKPVVFDVKTGQAVDTSIAGTKEIKSEVKKVVVAPADDVSRLPAFAAAPRPDDAAVVIGIESYRGLPRSAYSKGDALLVKRYLVAMGFQERNVTLLTDEGATATDLRKTLDTWLKNVVKPSSRVLVYYSGHGAPDPASGKGYLVPYDGDPEYLADTAYSLERLTATLNALPAKESVVLLDSCFSGMGGRSVLAKNARPLVTKTAGPALGSNVALLSATGSDQISTSSEELGHGVFTYHLLKALKEGRKDLASIYETLRPRVEDEAKRQNARQSPVLAPGLDKVRGRFRLLD